MTMKKRSSRKYISILLVICIIGVLTLAPKLFKAQDEKGVQQSLEEHNPIPAPESWVSYSFENVTLFAPDDLFFGLADPNYYVNSSSTYLLSNINDFSARQDWRQNEEFTISFSFYPKELSGERELSTDRLKSRYNKSTYLYDGYIASSYKAVTTRQGSTPNVIFFQINKDQVLKVNVSIIENIDDYDRKKYEEITNTVLNSILLN